LILRLLRHGVRIVVLLLLLTLFVVVGMETGWLTPYVFQKQINFVCDKLESSRCRQLLIKNVKGGIIWGLSVTRTDFAWKDKDGEVSFSAPFCMTDLFWKDIYHNFRKKKRSPFRLTIFHPRLDLKTSRSDLDESILKSLLIPFNQETPIPFQNMIGKLPVHVSQVHVLGASFHVLHKGKNEVSMKDINCSYTRKPARLSSQGQEMFSLRGDIHGKDIFFSSKKNAKQKEIYSIVRSALFDKDLIVNIDHGDSSKDSKIMLYIEDLFKIDGFLEYLDKGTFSSQGTIIPENIFWKKAKENKFLWRLLKDIDPGEYNSSFLFSGSEQGMRLKLSLHDKDCEEYCFINFYLDESSVIKADLDISGLISLKGDYDFLNGNISAKLDFKRIELARIMDLSGYERDGEITGEAKGQVEISGPLDNLTVKGELKVEDGSIDELDFQKAVFRFSGTGRFIFLENSKFVREEGDIPVVGYLDMDISNPLRNVKIKPKNALVWSGIDIIRNEEKKTLTLKSNLSDRLNLKVLKKTLQESGSLDEDGIGYKIELDLDESNKFMYKKDEDESFFGVERTIKF